MQSSAACFRSCFKSIPKTHQIVWQSQLATEQHERSKCRRRKFAASNATRRLDHSFPVLSKRNQSDELAKAGVMAPIKQHKSDGARCLACVLIWSAFVSAAWPLQARSARLLANRARQIDITTDERRTCHWRAIVMIMKPCCKPPRLEQRLFANHSGLPFVFWLAA